MNLKESPNSLKITRELNRTEITKPWSRTTGVFLLIFSLVWSAISTFIGSNFISSFFSLSFWQEFSALNLIMLFFGLIPLTFILLGFVCFIMSLAMIFNSSKIVLEGNLMSVSSGPLPFIPRKRIPKQNIRQVYIMGELNKMQKNSSFSDNDFILAFINGQNNSVPLFGKLFGLMLNFNSLSLQEAKQLEETIESHFNIEDQRVDNEFKHKKSGNSPSFFTKNYEEKENLDKVYNNNESPEQQHEEKSIIPYPKGLIVEENQDGFFAFKKWYNPSVYIILIFALIWNVFIGVILSYIIPLILAGESTLIIFLLFSTPFVYVGLYLLYNCAAIFFNMSTLHANEEMILLKTGPLSWKKNLRIPTAEIHYLETVTLKKKNRKGESYYVNTLNANLRNGKTLKIIDENNFINFPVEEIEFIHKKIEAYLKK